MAICITMALSHPLPVLGALAALTLLDTDRQELPLTLSSYSPAVGPPPTLSCWVSMPPHSTLPATPRQNCFSQDRMRSGLPNDRWIQ